MTKKQGGQKVGTLSNKILEVKSKNKHKKSGFLIFLPIDYFLGLNPISLPINAMHGSFFHILEYVGIYLLII